MNILRVVQTMFNFLCKSIIVFISIWWSNLINEIEYVSLLKNNELLVMCGLSLYQMAHLSYWCDEPHHGFSVKVQFPTEIHQLWTN